MTRGPPELETEKSDSEREGNGMREVEIGVMHFERGPQAEEYKHLWKLEKAETGFHLTASRTNSSANTLTLTKQNLFQSPGFQNCKRMNLHHPKPLNP